MHKLHIQLYGYWLYYSKRWRGVGARDQGSWSVSWHQCGNNWGLPRQIAQLQWLEHLHHYLKHGMNQEKIKLQDLSINLKYYKSCCRGVKWGLYDSWNNYFSFLSFKYFLGSGFKNHDLKLISLFRAVIVSPYS